MIDVRGLSCPEPVIIVRQAVKTGEAEYSVLTDNRTSVENITRFAENSGYSVSCENNGKEFRLTLTKRL